MLTFTTESGSTYELDKEMKRLRRLEGTTPLTRVGAHGEWRPFADISEVIAGKPVSVVWRWDNEDGQLIARSTITSRVMTVMTLDPTSN